jgi:hypothetical protein
LFIEQSSPTTYDNITYSDTTHPISNQNSLRPFSALLKARVIKEMPGNTPDFTPFTKNLFVFITN